MAASLFLQLALVPQVGGSSRGQCPSMIIILLLTFALKKKICPMKSFVPLFTVVSIGTHYSLGTQPLQLGAEVNKSAEEADSGILWVPLL